MDFTGTPENASSVAEDVSTATFASLTKDANVQLQMTSIPPMPAVLRHPTLVQPLPNWEEARNIFGWAWELHIYALGSLFAVVAFYSLICILQLCRLSTKRSVRCFFVLLHLIIFVFGVTRAVFLLLDPYNSQRILPQFVAAACLHLSFPCLTSAFCMVLAGLVRTARLKLLKSRIMNVYLLMGILLGNFAFAIGAEIVVDLTKMNVFSVASQTYFVAWSVGLGIGFLIMYKKLLLAAHDADGFEQGAKRIAVAVSVTLFSATLLLIFAGLHIYALIAIYTYLVPESDYRYDAWRWFGFHSGTRVTELLLASLIAFVASLTMWTRAARRTSLPNRVQRVQRVPLNALNTVTGVNTLNGVEQGEEKRQQQLLLTNGRATPSSPGPENRVYSNKRDFPVTFNPDGGKTDDEFLGGRFPNRQRKPVSQLLEGNPIHNVDEDRYG